MISSAYAGKIVEKHRREGRKRRERRKRARVSVLATR